MRILNTKNHHKTFEAELKPAAAAILKNLRLKVPNQVAPHNMFEATFHPAGVLKDVITALRHLVTDAEFECSDVGMAMQAMDSAHVALVQLFLDAEQFQQYRCDRPLRLGVHVGSLHKIVKMAAQKDTIVLSAEYGKANLVIKIMGEKRVSEFSLKLLDIEADTLGIPPTEPGAEIMMPAKEFKQVCDDMVVVGLAVHIDVKKECVVFHTEGDMGTGKVTYLSSDKEIWGEVVVEVKDPVRQLFALKYLQWIAAATPLSNYVTLCLTKEVPLCARYPIVYPLQNTAKGVQYGYMRYWLAPKVDD